MAPRTDATSTPQADSDQQVRQMVADPAAYFARSRAEARKEAHRYVAARVGRSTHPRTA